VVQWFVQTAEEECNSEARGKRCGRRGASSWLKISEVLTPSPTLTASKTNSHIHSYHRYAGPSEKYMK
jgi:hypothetical protein